ncbi:Alpha/Beta hydrolase protein [Clohesyomyces aquaticus]|uniref:Alpha/Beta hydrolase protein n=1 Tax=Clohesyomyces aquaticus TaxID=1231657 RepID=A0A1Y1ZAX7_9PLEO|nr:Alpha/Beta hydrolase protein [Clohesyomyces aquaticus]
MSPTGRVALLLSALSAFTAAQKLDASCADVVIFMARGNDAPYHDDRTFPLVDATCAKFTTSGMSCGYVEIQFDVTLGGPYCDQVAEGTRNGVSQITAFNQKCPNTNIVVNGYSEGAHVAGNVLGGPEVGGCTTVAGVSRNSAARQAIKAALLWGDVRHTANQVYNVDGAGRQKYPRTGSDLANLNTYSSVLRSYCAAGDPVCADGTVVEQHLNYFRLYTNDASDWIVSKIPKKTSSSSSSAQSGSTVVPTPSSGTVSATITPVGPTATGGAACGGYGQPVCESYPTPMITSSSKPSGTSYGYGHGSSNSTATYVPVHSETPVNACPVVYVTQYV